MWGRLDDNTTMTSPLAISGWTLGGLDHADSRSLSAGATFGGQMEHLG